MRDLDAVRPRYLPRNSAHYPNLIFVASDPNPDHLKNWLAAGSLPMLAIGKRRQAGSAGADDDQVAVRVSFELLVVIGFRSQAGVALIVVSSGLGRPDDL